MGEKYSKNGKRPQLEPEPDLVPFEDGFTRRTVLAAVFVGFIMLPASIYLSLVMGVALGGAAQWVTVILFIEVAKRSLVQLKRQEVLLIYLVAGSMIAPGVIMGAAGLTLSGGAFAETIWQQFLVQSPQAEAFGLTDKIPRWVVPPAGADSLIRRTFFSAQWLIPIVVLLIHQFLFRINFTSLGYALYRITNDVEKLEFPLAPVAAEGATALADASGKRETWRWRLFGTGAMIGLAYGLLYVAIPTFTGIVLTKPLQLLPIPYVDLTDRLGTFLGGSMFGLMTDLGLIFVGFVLPFRVVLGMFAGSIVTKVILPPLLTHWKIVTTWHEGMEARPTDMALSVDVYISISIGLGVVVAVIGIISVIRSFIKRGGDARRTSAPPPEARGRGEMALWKALAIWAASSAGYVVLC
ncbi:MAG: peptide transporter, partial [Pseudomonadota bacterium]